jgi:hypothetical protein
MLKILYEGLVPSTVVEAELLVLLVLKMQNDETNHISHLCDTSGSA